VGIVGGQNPLEWKIRRAMIVLPQQSNGACLTRDEPLLDTASSPVHHTACAAAVNNQADAITRFRMRPRSSNFRAETAVFRTLVG
jgi:hypothetical protein